MRIRGIRGAIQLDKDTPDEMVSAVSELLSQMLTANQLETEDLISIIFTATPETFNINLEKFKLFLKNLKINI